MTDKDVFILGAGFSRAISPQMPIMNELTDQVRVRIDNSEVSLPPPLMDSEDRRRELDNNIELWMTYLSQSQPWLDESFNQHNQALATRIRRFIREVINERTANSMSARLEWLETLIQQWSLRQATVLTLNYDTLVERAALSLSVPEINTGEGIYPSQIYPP